MEQDVFNRRVEAAEKRLEALTDEQRESSAGLWDELSAILRELQAAGEALHRLGESQGETQMANRLLRSLFDVMPVGVTVCDGDGTILMNNSAAEAILGSGVVGDVHHPKRTYSLHRLDGAPFPAENAPLVRALSGDIVRDAEILIRRADGGERVVLAGAAPVCDEAGHIISGVAVFQDITRHKQAEEAVENLAKFPSENPNPVIRVMKDGTIHYSNQGGQCLLDKWRSQVGEHVPDEWQTLVAEALEAGLDRTAEISCNERTFTFTIVPVVESGYVNLYGLDITRRRQAEEARRRLAAILEATRDIVSTSTVDGRTLYLNRTARRLLGIPDDVTPLDWVIPAGYPGWTSEVVKREGIPTAMRGGYWEGETTVLGGDGREIPVSQVIIAHRDEDGEVAYFSAVARDVTEYKRLMADLERERTRAENERRRLQAIMENTPTHLAYLDPQFNFVMVNPAYAEGSGYTEEQLVGRGQFELFPHEENQAVFERVRETGEPVKFVAKPFEFPDRPELGTTYWDWTLAPVKDADGQMLGLVLSLMDVTEQEQAQQRLRQYADRLRVLHEADQAILAARSVDEIAESALGCAPQLLEGCVRAGVALYDLDQGEVSLLAVHAEGKTGLGKGWCGPMDPAWVAMLEALARGKPFVIEDMQAVSATSTFVGTLQAEGLRAYVTVPLLIEGRLIGSLDFGMSDAGGLTSDRMEVAVELADELAVGIQQARLNEQVQRHTEELESLVAQRTRALRDREARLRAIFDNAALGIAVMNLQGRLLETNRALQAMLGYSGEELCGKCFTELAHSEDVEADLALYRELTAGERDSYVVEKRYVRKNGQVIDARLNVSLIRSPHRKPQFGIGLVEDITAQKQTQEALVRAEKLTAAGRLAASLAHEINNPLQSVIGFLELARESLEMGEEGEVGELLQVAAEELERAAGFVSDLHDLNRPSDPGDRKPVDVNLRIEHTLMLTREQCQKYGVEVEWEPAAGLPALMLVPDRMHQVFLNLTLNALEAMPEGGRLHIGTNRTGDPAWVRVTFADTGSGIAPDGLPHVFEPFYTTKKEGLGLGLYITRNIVEEHGGRIEVESKPGEGTTFTVWLPIPVEEGAREGES